MKSYFAAPIFLASTFTTQYIPLPISATANCPAWWLGYGGPSMVMQPGERWHCVNSACRCVVVVESGTIDQGANPRCSCGSVMKKDFKPPVFSYLDFLKLDPPLVTAEKSDQD